MKGFVDGSFECELYTTFDVNINSLPEFLFGYATQYFETQKIKRKSEEILKWNSIIIIVVLKEKNETFHNYTHLTYVITGSKEIIYYYYLI